MSVPLTVNGITYDYPVTSDELWGTEATDWAVAITTQLENLIVEGDLGPTVLISITNNQAAPTNVNGLAFDPTVTRSANIDYYVYRTYNSGALEVAESGTLYVTYLDIANVWRLVRIGDNVAGSGVDFDITPAGQVTYVSSNLTPAVSYSGSMKFRAKVLNKT